jgi:hypothetical protein
MLKDFTRILIVASFVLGIVACTQRQGVIPFPVRNDLIGQRAVEYYSSLASGKYERMYEMLSESVRGEISKESYVASLKEFFTGVGMSVQPTRVVYSMAYEVRTKTIMALKYSDRTIAVCESLVWVWKRTNWYVDREYGTCSAMTPEMQ